MEIWPIVVGGAIGAVSSLLGIFLQSYLTRKQLKSQLQMEIRTTTYSRLLAALSADELRPIDFSVLPSPAEQEAFKDEVESWEQNRKKLKTIAAEALLFTSSKDLRSKLSDFISGPFFERDIHVLEKLMKEEIEA